MNFTTNREPSSTAVISYRLAGGYTGQFQNIYTDYPINSTDSLRFIEAAAEAWILETEDKEESYRAHLAILQSAVPAVLIPGWSYWFNVIALDEDEEEGDQEEWEEDEEEDGEE
jgi:hypothetical protein